jgi:hypothetical protein
MGRLTPQARPFSGSPTNPTALLSRARRATGAWISTPGWMSVALTAA